MTDMLHPPVSLLCKLASVIVHADEAAGEQGHEFDIDALRTALDDPEIAEWIEQMTAAALAPRKRN